VVNQSRFWLRMGGGGEASIELTSFVQAFTALMAEAAMETAIESFMARLVRWRIEGGWEMMGEMEKEK
jgi:hypothetical protein